MTGKTHKWKKLSSGQVSCVENRGVMVTCHACDNQSHPRPKDLPSCLVPLSLCPHNPTQNTTRPCPNEHSCTRATTVLAQARVPHTRLLEFLLKFFVASLYLDPFHLCILLFSSRLYHYPIPTLYLSLYLLHLVI